LTCSIRHGVRGRGSCVHIGWNVSSSICAPRLEMSFAPEVEQCGVHPAIRPLEDEPLTGPAAAPPSTAKCRPNWPLPPAWLGGLEDASLREPARLYQVGGAPHPVDRPFCDARPGFVLYWGAMRRTRSSTPMRALVQASLGRSDPLGRIAHQGEPRPYWVNWLGSVRTISAFPWYRRSSRHTDALP
jgi:hypothetical protein